MRLLEAIRNWFRAVAGTRHEHRASEDETSLPLPSKPPGKKGAVAKPPSPPKR